MMLHQFIQHVRCMSAVTALGCCGARVPASHCHSNNNYQYVAQLALHLTKRFPSTNIKHSPVTSLIGEERTLFALSLLHIRT